MMYNIVCNNIGIITYINRGIIMVTMVFSDKIVNATQLRNSQKKWFDTALSEPVTVTYGTDNLAIYNREKFRNLYRKIYFTELALKICNEMIKGEKSTIIPWMEYLDAEDKKQFHEDLLSGILKATAIDNWDEVEVLLDDWKATADAVHSPEIMRALKTKTPKSELVAIK